MRYRLLFLFFFISIISHAQEAKDTSSTESYFDVNVSVGDNYFTPRPIAKNTAIKKVYYSIGAGYYHKSGLALAGYAYFTPDKGSTTIYQTTITPSYDYSQGKHFGFGASYSHYFNKDSVSFYQSPLKDELTAYISYKNKIVEPSLSYTYAWGSQTVKILNQTKKVSGHDYAFTLALKKEIDWENTIAKDDELTFTPTLSLTGGSSSYGLNGAKGQAKAKLRRTTTNNTNTTSTASSFALQDLMLGLQLDWKIKKFYIQPSVSLDYYLPEGGSFSTYEYITLGYSF